MVLEVEDLHRGYGKDYHYLLQRHKQMPSFNAFVSPANISVPSGGTAAMRIDVEGKLKRPAYLSIEGLPRGFTTSSLKLRGGRRWDVSITSPKGAQQGRYPISVKMNYESKDGNEQADVLAVDNMMQAFYYTHHIQAAELVVDVAEPSPYRLSLNFDLDEEILFSMRDEVIPIKLLIDKNPDFNEPIELMLGRKNGIFSLDPISILPEEREKVIYIKLNGEVPK